MPHNSARIYLTERTMSAQGLHRTSDVVVAFARQGLAIETIARALVIPTERVTGMCVRAFSSGTLEMIPPAKPADVKSSMMSELVNLRAQLDESRETIRALGGGNNEPLGGEFYHIAGLTRTEAEICGALVRRGRLTKDAIFAVVYGLDDDTPLPKIVDVFVCKIRKKLRPHGIEISTLWGVGYEMTSENIAKLKALASPSDSPSLVPTIEEMVA